MNKKKEAYLGAIYNKYHRTVYLLVEKTLYNKSNITACVEKIFIEAFTSSTLKNNASDEHIKKCIVNHAINIIKHENLKNIKA